MWRDGETARQSKTKREKQREGEGEKGEGGPGVWRASLPSRREAMDGAVCGRAGSLRFVDSAHSPMPFEGVQRMLRRASHKADRPLGIPTQCRQRTLSCLFRLGVIYSSGSDSFESLRTRERAWDFGFTDLRENDFEQE